MIEHAFEPGQPVMRTGPDLPHLGVFNGQVYEVEDFARHHAEGLYVRGVPEGLDPAKFPTDPGLKRALGIITLMARDSQGLVGGERLRPRR